MEDVYKAVRASSLNVTKIKFLTKFKKGGNAWCGDRKNAFSSTSKLPSKNIVNTAPVVVKIKS